MGDFNLHGITAPGKTMKKYSEVHVHVYPVINYRIGKFCSTFAFNCFHLTL